MYYNARQKAVKLCWLLCHCDRGNEYRMILLQGSTPGLYLFLQRMSRTQ